MITHGTDTTEETAIPLDLVLGDPRPIVLTDAQRPAEPRTATDPATSRMPLPWRRIPPLGDCARPSSSTGCAPRSRDRRQ
ncbi:MAG TPA: asparaginase domain-containing protein [Nocardioidaceae bacterium]|nr:asparaginase domain-containing protein [Nocardioidaceae bacterium]